jgi:predicted DNA-binding transcriptional regulator YafY
MNRIDRLQAILTTLQSKRIVTAESLAEKFEVSIRTIYRDIRSLEEGGIPIGAEAGIGYYILQGYHLPPVMFTHEEARALLMASKMVEQMTDQHTSNVFANALTKIRSVLDSAKKEELEDLESKIMVLPNAGNLIEQQEFILDKIKEALARSVRVSFDYFTGGTREHSTRKIEPLGLCYYGNYWHLIGFCLLRQDYRDFRVDRISEFSIKTERFKTSEHPSLKQYIEKLTNETPLQKIVIQLEHNAMKHINNSKYQMGFMSETKLEDSYEIEFAFVHLEYFARWLLMLGKQVKVIEPESLIIKLKEIVEMLKIHYLNEE